MVHYRQSIRPLFHGLTPISFHKPCAAYDIEARNNQWPWRNGLPGPVEDFAWGWLTDTNEQLGRPVDVISGPDGTLYVTDDSTGVIYRITYAGDE